MDSNKILEKLEQLEKQVKELKDELQKDSDTYWYKEVPVTWYPAQSNTNCIKCGMTLSDKMFYTCYNQGCPIGLTIKW